MTKVNVLDNLPPDADEEAFVRWWMTTHHAANIAGPDTISTDSYRVIGMAGVGAEHPASSNPPYRFMTMSNWESDEAFDEAWNIPEEQARLIPAFAKITEALPPISEELETYRRDGTAKAQ
jgi:hypothetical protein